MGNIDIVFSSISGSRRDHPEIEGKGPERYDCNVVIELCEITE